jgi:hypothetical protein
MFFANLQFVWVGEGLNKFITLFSHNIFVIQVYGGSMYTPKPFWNNVRQGSRKNHDLSKRGSCIHFLIKNAMQRGDNIAFEPPMNHLSTPPPHEPPMSPL